VVDLLREGFSARAGTSHRNYRNSSGLSQVKQCAAHTWDVQVTHTQTDDRQLEAETIQAHVGAPQGG